MFLFVFHDVEVLLFPFRLIVEFSTAQDTCAHEDGAKRRFHVMNHGIREVFTYFGYFVLFRNHFDLLHQAIDDDEQKEYGSYKEHTHLQDDHFIRIFNGSLYTFGEIFPDRVDLCLHLAVEPDEIVVLCEIFYVFVMGRVYCNGVDAEAKLSQIDFIQFFPIT